MGGQSTASCFLPFRRISRMPRGVEPLAQECLAVGRGDQEELEQVEDGGVGEAAVDGWRGQGEDGLDQGPRVVEIGESPAGEPPRQAARADSGAASPLLGMEGAGEIITFEVNAMAICGPTLPRAGMFRLPSSGIGGFSYKCQIGRPQWGQPMTRPSLDLVGPLRVRTL